MNYVWPIPILTNVFTALKGSKFYCPKVTDNNTIEKGNALPKPIERVWHFSKVSLKRIAANVVYVKFIFANGKNRKRV